VLAQAHLSGSILRPVPLISYVEAESTLLYNRMHRAIGSSLFFSFLSRSYAVNRLRRLLSFKDMFHHIRKQFSRVNSLLLIQKVNKLCIYGIPHVQLISNPIL